MAHSPSLEEIRMNSKGSPSSIPNNLDNLIKRRQAPSHEQILLIVAEYNALRDEILKRSEFRNQIISFALIISGTILTIGLQPNSPPYILFVFPILGLFLAGMWKRNMVWGRRLSTYIQENVENKFNVTGWEADASSRHKARFSFIMSTTFSAGGLFLGVGAITFILGLLKSTYAPIDIGLIAIDGVCLLATLLTLLSRA